MFTPDPDRAYAVARQLRSGTVGMNSFRTDFGIAFGGFKQSGVGREGGKEGLVHFLETKTVILDERSPTPGTMELPEADASDRPISTTTRTTSTSTPTRTRCSAGSGTRRRSTTTTSVRLLRA